LNGAAEPRLTSGGIADREQRVKSLFGQNQFKL
jgi:hypothetical protein